MGTYRKEWDCCGSVTETEAWEPEHCPFCTVAAEELKGNALLLKFVPALASEGITMSIVAGESGLAAWFEDGFYKADGCTRLVVEDGHILLYARYGERREISSVDDVIRCSKQWHEFSEDRFDGWKNPPANWQRLYGRLNT